MTRSGPLCVFMKKSAPARVKCSCNLQLSSRDYLSWADSSRRTVLIGSAESRSRASETRWRQSRRCRRVSSRRYSIVSRRVSCCFVLVSSSQLSSVLSRAVAKQNNRHRQNRKRGDGRRGAGDGWGRCGRRRTSTISLLGGVLTRYRVSDSDSDSD